MKDLPHPPLGVCLETTSDGEIVSIFVNYNHPLLQLGGTLPWAQITEVVSQDQS